MTNRARRVTGDRVRADRVDVASGGSVALRVQRFARRQPLALIAFGVVLYSCGPLLVRGSSVTGPVYSFWRLWLGVVVLGAAFAVHQARTGHRHGLAALRVSALAGLAFGGHQLAFMSAIKLVGVTEVTLVATLSPIVTGLLAIPFFGERVSRRFRAWSLVAMAGSALVVLAGARGPSGDPLGTTLAVANVFLFALFFVLSKRSRDHLSVVPFLFGVTLVAAVAVSAFGVATGQRLGSPTSTDWLLIVLTVLGPGTLGHFVMTWPLRWVPANVPPVMRLAIPFLAGGAAWVVFDERITLAHLLGGTITVVGVAGALLTRPRQPAPQPEGAT